MRLVGGRREQKKTQTKQENFYTDITIFRLFLFLNGTGHNSCHSHLENRKKNLAEGQPTVTSINAQYIPNWVF